MFLVPRSATVEHWQVVHKVIDFYVDQALRDAIENPEQDRRNLMDGLVHQTSERHEIRNQIIQSMMTAQDTIASLVSNTVFLLSRSPDIWERLQDEAASAGSNPLTLEDTRKFNLLRNVLNECK